MIVGEKKVIAMVAFLVLTSGFNGSHANEFQRRCELNPDHFQPNMSLGCSGGDVLHIINVAWGRKTAAIHSSAAGSVADRFCPAMPGVDDSTICASNKVAALAVVNTLCRNKASCIIRPENEEFGDPCPGVYKYLEVTYTCANFLQTTQAPTTPTTTRTTTTPTPTTSTTSQTTSITTTLPVMATTYHQERDCKCVVDKDSRIQTYSGINLAITAAQKTLVSQYKASQLDKCKFNLRAITLSNGVDSNRIVGIYFSFARYTKTNKRGKFYRHIKIIQGPRYYIAGGNILQTNAIMSFPYTFPDKKTLNKLVGNNPRVEMRSENDFLYVDSEDCPYRLSVNVSNPYAFSFNMETKQAEDPSRMAGLCGDCYGPVYALSNGTDVGDLPEKERLEIISNSYKLN